MNELEKYKDELINDIRKSISNKGIEIRNKLYRNKLYKEHYRNSFEHGIDSGHILAYNELMILFNIPKEKTT